MITSIIKLKQGGQSSPFLTDSLTYTQGFTQGGYNCIV